MSTREEAERTLGSLGVADVFVQSYRKKSLPLNLEIYFGPPEEFFTNPETREACTEGRLIPLLDDGNFGVVTFLDPDTRQFIQKDVESPEETLTVLASWQQYLAELFIRIADSGVEDAELEEIAHVIGFQHMERTLEFLDSVDEADWDRQCADFIASI